MATTWLREAHVNTEAAAARERRAHRGVECRQTEGQAPVVFGYAAVFDRMSEPLGFSGFREVVRPGAFTDTLKVADVRALVEHQPARIFARSKAGNLRLREDSIGLWFEADVPGTTTGQDLLENVRLGNLDACSFAFLVRAEGERWRYEGETLVRELLALDLEDVSVVAYPAYVDTTVALRSLDRAGLQPPAVEPDAPAPLQDRRWWREMAMKRLRLLGRG